MAQSILIFDFGTNEEAAQQARHKVDGWKQAFRLGDKLLLKFDREESAATAPKDGEEASADGAPKPAAKAAAKGKGGAKKTPAKARPQAENEETAEPAARVRVFLRLAFSDHEKLSYQRWLDRIPTEEPFKSVQGETVRSGQSDFEKASEQFEALD
ncbi:MAG TPA: hypothetical protein VHX36_15075 [Candidatus Acidoferrales bacterium]|jgi:hypothetical protein|nr:hypothetical protein [Candidatus Acidoferrales bacterium]